MNKFNNYKYKMMDSSKTWREPKNYRNKQKERNKN